ncbi:CAAX prenyl protease 1 homolog [Macadamia integrifolia]|uniref:CAAX prenyl protease 1 homolog n=1 Tax=Macadamia integrifolia TaxID=60698 RepID=UPI001C4F1203|nr:CAAX prenyl protease 1 homolog [Macadamia integrifolia]
MQDVRRFPAWQKASRWLLQLFLCMLIRIYFKVLGLTQPVLIGLIIFERTVNLLQHLLSFGLNLVIRSFEFQADAFAKKLGYVKALRAGLVKLQEENLSSMNTDPWYSAYHYTRPPPVERLAALDEPDKKVE